MAESKHTDLVILAIPSLREPFEAIVPEFERAHPEAKVKLAFAEGRGLRRRRDVDVVASEDAGANAIMARNEPVIIVPRGNPAHVERLIDLLRVERLVIAGPQVPIGGCTRKIFETAGHKFGGKFRQKLSAVTSRKPGGGEVVQEVAGGRADAGIAFRSDARAAKDRLDVVTMPDELNVLAPCSIAVVAGSRAQALAQAWVDLVLSPAGQRQLAAAGFRPA